MWYELDLNEGTELIENTVASWRYPDMLWEVTFTYGNTVYNDNA